MTDDVHDLAALYAIDSLDGAELIDFEEHYATCAMCRVEVAELRESTSVLALAASSKPPPDLKAMVMAEVADTPQLDPRGKNVVDLALASKRLHPPSVRAFWAAAAMAIVIAGIAGLLLYKADTSVDDVRTASDAIETTLTGNDGEIEAIWSREYGRVALVADGLVGSGVGRTYELWFVLGDGVGRAGLFEPDESGSLRVVLDVEDVAALGFGVTIEPEGGSNQPTSDILFVGELET